MWAYVSAPETSAGYVPALLALDATAVLPANGYYAADTDNRIVGLASKHRGTSLTGDGRRNPPVEPSDWLDK